MSRTTVVASILLLCLACGRAENALSGGAAETPSADEIARGYLRLGLALGAHDPNWIDAYYGPESVREAALAEGLEVGAIATAAQALRGQLAEVPPPEDPVAALRLHFLDRQLGAVSARAAMLGGEKLSFAEESRRLYDSWVPRHDAAYYQAILDRLDVLLDEAGVAPGSTAERVQGIREQLVVPPEMVDAVFRRALDECRTRTQAHLQLPEGESFEVDYVHDQPWSAYNWYQGDYRSLIQVNLDQPFRLDRAVDLGCHEGYPGHHVYNTLLEQELVRGRGWPELSAYFLFSPESLIAEGTGNLGVEMSFPGKERTAFERDVLAPLAGLDPAAVELNGRVRELTEALAFAGNEAARGIVDGTLMRDEAKDWLETYVLMTPSRAEQRLAFIDRYGAYGINYNLGLELTRAFVDRASGDDPASRWAAFRELLTTPRVASSL